jgi:glycosyltransferase involved in cell wall biosynthesis
VKISTCIITFNEEKNIRDCIESVLDFSDEILVVDSESTDNTVKIVKELGARVIIKKWPGHVAQKQFTVDNALFNWIFSLDADERASSELSLKLIDIKENYQKWDEYRAFYVNRRNYYFGKWIKYGGWYPEKRIRFFHRDYAKWGGTNPHDKVIPNSNCKVFDINLDIIHFPYKDITHHFNTIGSYSSIAAEENIRRGKKVYFMQIVYKPVFKFFRDYIFKKGFLLGKVGFIHAVMGAISVFMKYLKTYEKQLKD